MNSKLVKIGTPWEEYKIRGKTVHVKREDLCCPYPGPAFSKIRGVEPYLEKLDAGTPVGVLDTFHSKAGWAVSYVCRHLKLPCYNFFPYYANEKRDTDQGLGVVLRQSQYMSQGFGANLEPMKAGRSAILYHQAKKLLAELTDGEGVMMPNALKLEESVEATAKEVHKTARNFMMEGTWIVPISSGTLAAGVLRGLDWREFAGDFIVHLGYTRSVDATRNYIINKADPDYLPNSFKLIDEGFNYKDKVSNEDIPFPCNPYYDAKTWQWLAKGAIDDMVEPIVFWNIGE